MNWRIVSVTIMYWRIVLCRRGSVRERRCEEVAVLEVGNEVAGGLLGQPAAVGLQRDGAVGRQVAVGE